MRVQPRREPKLEFKGTPGEQEELKNDKVDYLKRVKRMRREHTEMNNALVDLRGGWLNSCFINFNLSLCSTFPAAVVESGVSSIARPIAGR